MQAIYFFNHDRKPTLHNKKRLKAFIHELFVKEKIDPEQVAYIFCSDEYIYNINKTFLNHSYYTDVIGFNLSQNPGNINAEIYISIDRVKDNALTEGVSFREELHRIIFHGSLHFCGYKDKRSVDREKMRKTENLYLKKYFNL
jgi:probable rRNA maturation factor